MVTKARQTNFIFDADLQLKDAGLIAADVTITDVGGSDAIIDLGGNPMSSGVLVVDVSAIEIASNDERYVLALNGSDSATFASGIETLALLELGALEVIYGDVDSDVGRYTVPFINDRNGRRYRYLSLQVDVSGTIATGINFIAYISKGKEH